MSFNLLHRKRVGQKFYSAWSLNVDKDNPYVEWDTLSEEEQEKWSEAGVTYIREFAIALQITYAPYGKGGIHDVVEQ